MSSSAALALVTVGALLLFLECNRPGYILPGACGLLLLLLGVNRLQTCGGQPDRTLWMAFAGLAVIGCLRWRLLAGAPALLGTGLLTTAFVHLAGCTGGELSRVWAGACGLLLGTTSSGLMILAGQAWRAKTGHLSDPTKASPAAEAECWGVD